MASAANRKVPQVAVGITSIVLGMIGLALFFLPILGTTIGACGVICGIAGIGMGWAGYHNELRSACVGLLLSSVAVTLGLAINYAPIAYEPSNAVPRLWQAPMENRFVPPPARPFQFDIP
ncbi:MAG TPA: hypothetical protein VGN12_12650 [Pirellulales bacterium]|jgi:hypothetical protein